MTEQAGQTTMAAIELNESELQLVRAALRLLASTLGREQADELAEVQALLARLDASRRG